MRAGLRTTERLHNTPQESVMKRKCNRELPLVDTHMKEGNMSNLKILFYFEEMLEKLPFLPVK